MSDDSLIEVPIDISRVHDAEDSRWARLDEVLR